MSDPAEYDFDKLAREITLLSAPAEYDFDKLAREITMQRIRDAGCTAADAAEIANKIIVAGIASTQLRQAPRLTIIGVCRGVMSGLLLADKDLVAASVEIMKSMANLSQETHQDPADMMTWTMEAIAGIATFAPPDVKLGLREALENNFMGTGEIFGELCAKADASRAA